MLMPLAGERLTFGWALALCYHVGWRGKDLEDAVALMCAESARYTEAWHANMSEDGTQVTSTDWGLFQINDRWHPDLEIPFHLNPIENAKFAHGMFKASKGFSPWAAYNSGSYEQFLPDARKHRALARWENKVPNVEKRWG